MFITKRHISRRTMLRGAGVALGLPLLDSMIPAATAMARTAASPKSRFTGIEIAHGSAGSCQYGTDQNLWMPKTEGRDFEFTPILKPLEPFRDYVTVISMMDCKQA